MKNLALKAFSLFLIVLMLVSAVACSNTGDGSNTNDTAEASAEITDEETASLYDENGYLLDSIDPELSFGDTEFTILYWSDREHEEFTVEGQNGDAVNDAIFTRNAHVEKRLGVKFNFIGTKGNASGANLNNFVTTVENSYNGGDHAYDMIAAHSFTTAACAAKGFLLDLNPYNSKAVPGDRADSQTPLDFSKPWWPDSLINEAMIRDQLYFASGDISANTIYMMYVTFFNKQMLDDLSLESPYDLVKKNEWTIDKMFDMCKNIYADSNGNGVKDIGDTYGQYAYTLHLDAFLIGSGIRIVDTSANELAISDSFTSEKADTLTTKVTNFFKDHNQAYLLTENVSVHQYFSAGKSLFWNDRCRNAITFKEKDASFGIVPNPKYDAGQEQFCTVLGNPFSLYAIMADCKTPEKSAAVMECYASESYRVLSPQLYDITMKYRFTDDATSAEMFDLIRSTVIFDMGRIFSSSLNAPCGAWEDAVSGGQNWKVKSKGLAGVWKKQIGDLNDLFN